MSIDYTSFNKTGDNGQADKNMDKYWWLSATDELLANNIVRTVKTIAEYDSKRQTQYQISSRLYGNSDVMGVNGLSFSKSNSSGNSLKDRVSYNVIQSAIDTVTAKIAKNRPKPLFLTSGGDWKTKRRAQKLTKFVDGVFYENQIQKLSPKVFKDAGVNGNGFVKVYADNDRVKFQRCMAGEIYVDYMDGYYDAPRQMHHVMPIDRAALAAMFPNKKSKIMEANGTNVETVGNIPTVSDQVLTIESWRLPSSPDAKDGLHAIVINGETLFKEEWTECFFPFADMPWSKKQTGFWAQGAAEQIQNIQLEINKLLWVIQRSMHLAGSFKIFVENSSKIVKEHLSNDIGSVISYSGQQPSYLTPPVVPPEMYSHLQTLKNQAFEQVGVSQLSATSQKPAGLDSGRALREYNDIETERFMVIGQAYENYHMDLAKLSVWCAKKIYSKNKKLSVKYVDKKFIETIEWKDVDLDFEDFVTKIFPISSLPQDPSARLATIQEYVQAGFYTPRQAKRLMDYPDMEQLDTLQDANEDYLHKILEEIVEDGEYNPPAPDDDLDLALELSLEYIAQGKRDNVPDDRMEMLRTWNSQVVMLKTKAMPQPAPAQTAPQGPGMGSPQAPAIPMQASNLVPQVA